MGEQNKKAVTVDTPIYDTIHCSACDKEVTFYYTTFFADKHGLHRYGAMCCDCYMSLLYNTVIKKEI